MKTYEKLHLNLNKDPIIQYVEKFKITGLFKIFSI